VRRPAAGPAARRGPAQSDADAGARLARELDDASTRLSALSVEGGSVAVHDTLAVSYDDLDPPAAQMFRILGLHPGPAPSAAAEASALTSYGDLLSSTGRPEDARTRWRQAEALYLTLDQNSADQVRARLTAPISIANRD
jgi:hypothetical protein